MGPHVGPHVEPHLPSGFASFDDALKEAVRRSLQDVAPKEEAILAETQVVDTEETEEESAVAVDASPLEEFKDAPEEEDIVVEAESPVHKPAPVPSAPVEDAPASVSTHSSLKSFPNVDPVFDEAAEKYADPVFHDEDDEAAEMPVLIERDTTIASKQSEADDSFASDAVGSGDIAEAMGATLDMVAGVISEMLSEADAHNKPAASKKEAPRVSETSGAMILESTDGTKQDDEHSEGDTENEWHVVGSDDESLKQDEEIARAAEMLGSALFNSDMRSSEEVIPNSDTRSSGEAVSALSHSQGSYAESFSVASVPSTVPSIAHSWQVGASHRDRWSTQLSQLRELGFDDESLCVEIIERLNAANIGCDTEEEISVTQVVNALLKNN
jgi:Arc/MetJ-type ribon-helix-helix transcriptional regulator